MDSRTDVTQTYYDEAPFSIASFGSYGQENLRPRVATVTLEEIYDGVNSTYDYAYHYSYDIAGNVKSLVQEITRLHDFGHGYKRVDYNYDLISGNVHAVFFQKDSTDQFTHRYRYDENNRLVEAKTSFIETTPLGTLYDLDATYEYYLHGPLARTVLGQHGVQGCDYAYNLQGWIKGLNSGALLTHRDMGTDGQVDGNHIARDVFGYTLGYFEGDYQPIAGADQSFEIALGTSTFDSQTPDLFNGNIRHWVSHNKAIGDAWGQAYRYDQLHRIRQFLSFDDVNTSSWTWGSGSQLAEYKADYNYDPNGNLTALRRYDNNTGAGNNLMDRFTYNYTANTNLLTHVDDNITDQSKFEGDFEDQGTDNYSYDGAGNLIEDIQAGAEIVWTPYGKVDFVKRDSGQAITTLFGYGPNQNRLMKAGFKNKLLTPDTTYTYYFRDAQGNTLAVYQLEEDTVTWQEQHLYGSSRLGMVETNITWSPGNEPVDSAYYFVSSLQSEGCKRYELSDHLGNVRTVISDRHIGIDSTSTDTADYFTAVVLRATDYYPFGHVMRSYQVDSSYRYSFNDERKAAVGQRSSGPLLERTRQGW